MSAHACMSRLTPYNKLMAEHLRYGIETTDMNHRLFMDLPVKLAARIQNNNASVGQELRSLTAKKNRTVDLEPSDDGLRLYINTKKIGARREDHARRSVARRVVEIVSTIDFLAGQYDKDPNLNVQMGSAYTSDGRLHMRAEVKWPKDSTDNHMSNVTTYFMRDCARKLNYERKILDDLVYAQVMRENGLTLETNPLGSCSIGAGGYMYSPESHTVELYQHNIYSTVQQLICFTGAVALANADSLYLASS